MKAKVIATGEIIEVAPAFGGYFSHDGELIPQRYLEFNFEPSHSEATISGWVCRDKDGALCLYYENPMRGKEEWFGNYNCHLPEYSFPSLTWQDDPIEVEIIIKPKKQ